MFSLEFKIYFGGFRDYAGTGKIIFKRTFLQISWRSFCAWNFNNLYETLELQFEVTIAVAWSFFNDLYIKVSSERRAASLCEWISPNFKGLFIQNSGTIIRDLSNDLHVKFSLLNWNKRRLDHWYWRSVLFSIEKSAIELWRIRFL